MMKKIFKRVKMLLRWGIGLVLVLFVVVLIAERMSDRLRYSDDDPKREAP